MTVQKLLRVAFTLLLQLREISTRPNWISDRKSWRCKGSFTWP